MRQRLGRAKGSGLSTPLPKAPATCAVFCNYPLPTWGPGLSTNQATPRLQLET